MGEESSEYSRLSAEYCESLFSVAAFFFSCNEEVGRAVLSERPQDEAARSLQERIWQDDEYTRTFIDADRKVTAMIDWQCSLAEAANLE